MFFYMKYLYQNDNYYQISIFLMELKRSYLPFPQQQHIVSGVFIFNGIVTYLKLYQNSIYFSNDMTTQFYKLTFDFKYDVANEGNLSVITIYSPTPLKFYSYTFITPLWINSLSQCMNRLRFHDYFKLGRALGKGNFALVYLAQRIQDRMNFAVKVFAKSTLRQKINKDSLETEIKIFRKFNHRNICRLYEVFESQNSIYLIMEHIQGQILDSIMSKKKILHLVERKKIMREMISALYEISRKNIVHRDLKPSNIMINNAGEVKIIDFGLATEVNIPKYLFLKCGSPGFVAPQIISINQTCPVRMNVKSDIFSAGCLFYQMIFGHALFNEQDCQKIIISNLECNFTIPKYSEYSLEQQLDLLRKMLQKDPEKRISSLEALNHPYFTGQRPFQSLRRSQHIQYTAKQSQLFRYIQKSSIKR